MVIWVGLVLDLKIILLTALAAFMGSIGQLEFKRGANNLEFDLKMLLTNHHCGYGAIQRHSLNFDWFACSLKSSFLKLGEPF